MGTRIDVTASSIGDARSLQGGVLLPTTLRGPDGDVRASAQGAPVARRIRRRRRRQQRAGEPPPSDACRAADWCRWPWRPRRHGRHHRVYPQGSRLRQRRPSRSRAINAELGPDAAHALDSATVSVRVPAGYRSAVPDLIARLEPLSVDTDAVARVVINERTGTVVVGGAVRIGPAAVAHGNLSVRISTQVQASQPSAFSSKGDTTLVANQKVDVSEGTAQLVSLEQGTTLSKR